MNRALLQQCLEAFRAANRAVSAEHVSLLTEAAYLAVKAELEKPEPEPVAYMLTKRIFGLGGETWDTTEYRDYQWEYDCVPLYAAPIEPNCKFPTCHSQEYQDKLVQEILEPEPVAEITGHSYSQTNRRISFLPAGYELPVGTKLYTKEREP